MSGLTSFGYAKSVLVCVVILLALVAVQQCDAIPWSGSNSNFSWANGGSENGLFGNPLTGTGNTFTFRPLGLEAISLDGEDLSTFGCDTLNFDLHANSGYGFQTILIEESGDYEIDGIGTVAAEGNLSIVNLDTNATLPFQPSQLFLFTSDSPAQSTWYGSAQVSIPTSWTNIKVTFINALSATTTGDGSFASIANKDSAVTISVVQIPEPATICILGVSALSLLRRKKNK
jgi:hypothetical protein